MAVGLHSAGTDHRKELKRMDSKAVVVGIGIGIGVGIGSALMYWYDPSAGKRRRSHMRYEARRIVKQMQGVGKQLQGVRKQVYKTIDRTTGDLAKLSRMRVGEVAGALVPAKLAKLM
jgi:gas vesicle protein